MNENEKKEYLFTAAEAVKFINKVSGKQFRVSANIELPIPTSGGSSFFPGYVTVRTTRKEAVRVVESVLDHFEERGARIKVQEYQKIIFIG
ncbi:MAG: hypothetical protein ACYC36_17005 [Bellilinea sp.]